MRKFRHRPPRRPSPSSCSPAWPSRARPNSPATAAAPPGTAPNVITGPGTVGLEILDALPDVKAVVVRVGGGGLGSGIASAIKALHPSCKVYGCEVDTAAPLAVSLAAGRPQNVNHTPSFVDGIGGKGLLPEMWPLGSSLLAGSLVSSLGELAAAVRRR